MVGVGSSAVFGLLSISTNRVSWTWGNRAVVTLVATGAGNYDYLQLAASFRWNRVMGDGYEHITDNWKR